MGLDILKNHDEILAQVIYAFSDYKGQDWEGFGKNIGEILMESYVGNSTTLVDFAIHQSLSTLNISVAENVLLGLLKGLGSTATLADLDTCISLS